MVAITNLVKLYENDTNNINNTIKRNIENDYGGRRYNHMFSQNDSSISWRYEYMKNEIVLFENQGVKLEINIKDETIWISQQKIAELFDSSRTNIIEHINNIYSDGELDKISTCQDFRQVRKEGKRNVTRNIPFYNLDMIISVGYRVNSKKGIIFRKWANKVLKEILGAVYQSFDNNNLYPTIEEKSCKLLVFNY